MAMSTTSSTTTPSDLPSSTSSSSTITIGNSSDKITHPSNLIRSLTISNPTNSDEFTCKLKSNIILVAKYSFFAEGDNELNVNKGEILKLLDRSGNGWLLVKFIDKVHSPGLIPASYCDIAVNDQINPITLTWLHSNGDEEFYDIIQDHNYLDLQFSKMTNKFDTINNKPYPISASISNFLLANDRYWYRLDVGYSNGLKVNLCKYYQDFYNLHIELINLIDKHLDRKSLLKLPKLPEPIPTNFPTEDDLIQNLLKRCNDLNIYINKLILNKYIQTSPNLVRWLDFEAEDFPGLTHSDELNNEEINEKIIPGSVDVMKNYELKKEAEAMKEEEEDSMDNDDESTKEDLPTRSKSKNIYNNYQQAANAMIQRSATVKSVNDSSRSSSQKTSNSNPGNDSINSEVSNSSPIEEKIDTPNTSLEESPKKAQNIQTPKNQTIPQFTSCTTPKQPLQFTGQQIPQQNTQQFSQQFPQGPQQFSQPYPHHSPLSNMSPYYSSKLINSKMSSSSSPIHHKKPGFSPRIAAHHPNTPPMQSKMSPLGQMSPIFPINGYKQPFSPIPNDRHDYIKCKIVNYNNEIIAVKLNKSQIKSINDLKILIKQKVYYSKLYIKLPNLNNFENIDIINFNISEFLKFNDKVLLKIN